MAAKPSHLRVLPGGLSLQAGPPAPVLEQMLAAAKTSRAQFERDYEAQFSAEAKKPSKTGLFSPKRSVEPSEELRRILALPRRQWEPRAEEYATALTSHLKTPQGTQKLRPIQAAALVEMHDNRGLLMPAAVGAGKTLTSLLGFFVLESRRPLLLMPAKLIEKTHREAQTYKQHWIIPGYIRIESYEKLGRAQHVHMLEEALPDVIICDEVHRLRNHSAAVVKRVKRYLEAHPNTVFVGMSGTVMKRSILDFAHLSAWALRNKNPTPISFQDRIAWSMALDEKRDNDNRLAPGALVELCTPDEQQELLNTSEHEEALGIVRRAFRRRVTDTAGIVATQERLLGTSLRIENVKLPVPTTTATGRSFWLALEGLRDRWERPDGEPLMDAIELWRHLRELACGFFYRWMPPPPQVWRDKRRAWAAFVRHVLKTNRVHIDSESQVVKAVDDGHYDGRELAEWRAVKPIYTPQTEAVWLDDTVLNFCAAWMRGEAKEVDKTDQGGVVWVEHTEFGHELARRTGVPYYHRGGQNDTGVPIERHPPGKPLIASIASNSEGRNMQAWSRSLVVSPPQAGRTWEQCLDAQTEILTARGWLGVDDPAWAQQPAVAAYALDGRVHWSAATRVVRALGEEQMYGIQNPHLDIRVTAGHRMLCSRWRRFGNGGCDGGVWTDLFFTPASDMPLRWRIPLGGRQEAPGVPLTEAELTFLGLFYSDGNLSPGNSAISLFQSERYPYVIDLIEKTLRECGFRYGRRTMRDDTNFTRRNHKMHRWQVSHGRPRLVSDRHLRGWAALAPYIAGSKVVPDALLDMTRDQLTTFLAGLWAGDGSKTHAPGTCTIAVNAAQADKLQGLCVRRGLRCNISPGGKKVRLLRLSDDTTWSGFCADRADGRPVWGPLPSEPAERVWCATVDTGAIITRRNGKVAVVGNCLGRLHREGQEADEVVYQFLTVIPEQLASFERARRDATAISDTTGQPQKLTYADVVIDEFGAAPRKKGA